MMMNKTFSRYLILFLVLSAFFAEYSMAYDGYYLLNEGNIARDTGDLPGAVKKYSEYIKNNPFSSDDFSSRRFRKRSQYYLRNLLIAYDNLIDVLRDMEESEKIDCRLSELKSLYSPERFGAKNTYKLARILQENYRTEESIPLLERIVRNQQADHIPYNNKVMLRAFSTLMGIYAKRGNTAGQELLRKSIEQYPIHDLDRKDTYRLASLYLQYPDTRNKGEQLLEDMLNEAGASQDIKDISSVVKAAGRLMQFRAAQHDESGTGSVIEQCKSLLNRNLSPQQLYNIGIAFLKSGNKGEAIKILHRIVSNHGNTVWSRKSLFLIGRGAMAENDWDAAIEAYSTYIQRYPDHQFFALKAYANLLDAYWARDGDMEEQKVEVEKFADIVNQVSNYETQLNLARDLYHKGFEELANATFQLGYSAAVKAAENKNGTIEAARIRWQIAKYAAALEKYDIALENGNCVVNYCTQIDMHDLKRQSKRKVDYYLSRTYLWMAKAYENKGDYPAARTVLDRFLQQYPTDKDVDYVRFELCRLYEETLNYEKAAAMLDKIKDPVLRNKVKHRLFRSKLQ